MRIQLLSSLIALVLMGCGPKVSTEKVSNKDLSNYKTFAYLPNSNFDDYVKFETDNQVGMSVIENVNRNMQKVGYQLDRDNPDLLVLLSTSTNIERTVTTDPVYATYPGYYGRNYSVSPYYRNYYYYNYGGYRDLVGYDTDVNRYKEGTLLLNLIDSKSKEVIWKGMASDLIFQQNNSQAISQFVDDMFDEFPINK